MPFSYRETECSDLEGKVIRTINTLRSMRGVGTIYNCFDAEMKTPRALRALLADAQVLVEAASGFLVPYIAKEVEKDASAPWIMTLEQMEDKYERFQPVYGGGQSGYTAARRTLHRISGCLNIDEYYTVGQMYLDNSGVRYQVSDFTDGIGIVAPLSVDYLAASCFSRFIGLRFQVSCPSVQPVLLDTDKKEIAGCNQVGSRLAGEKKVVILLDAVGSESPTMQAMDAFARRCYQQQYRPQRPQHYS